VTGYIWLRSDLTAHGLGRGLVIASPRVALTYWRSIQGYTVTGPDGRTRTGLTVDGVRAWCAAAGVECPAVDDIDWLLTDAP
jgi:hypothetical protein